MDYPIRIHQQLPTILQAFRKQAGLTQAELAAMLGVTQQNVSELERNAGKVTVARLIGVLGLLGVEMVLRVREPETRQVGDIAPKTGQPYW